MKKILSVVLALSFAVGFSACSSSESKPLEETSETVVITEAPTEPPLSDSFDYELASGYDGENDFYQLVANEEDSYAGAAVSVAVIKNNKFLIEPTTMSPFNDEEGMLFGKTAKDTLSKIEYVGNGCFYYEGCLWNSKTNKSFNGAYDLWELKTRFAYNGEYETICNNDGMFLFYADVALINVGYNTKLWNTGKMLLVDSNTMTTKVITFDDNYFSSGVYTDGLVYLKSDYFAEGMFDVNGNKVIDLSEYNIYSEPGFKNGKAIFKIKNNAGTFYMITMDKTGKVLDSVQVDK